MVQSHCLSALHCELDCLQVSVHRHVHACHNIPHQHSDPLKELTCDSANDDRAVFELNDDGLVVELHEKAH